MRQKMLCLVAGVAGACGGDPTTEPPLPPGPAGWAISVDTSQLVPFVPVGTPTWSVGGHARSSEPLAGVDVAGTAAPLDGGDFAADVAIAGQGITMVPIVARDTAGHERKAHRALLSSHFLPEGALNDRMMTLALSQQVLDGLNAQIREQIGEVDVAAQAMGAGPIQNDQDCVIEITGASQGAFVVELQRRAATDLWMHVKLSDLAIQFAGTCQVGLVPVPVEGNLGGTFDIASRIDAKAPADGEVCLTGFDHTTPDVTISNWVYHVGSPNPVYNVAVQALAPSSDEAKAQVHDELQTQLDTALTEQLGNAGDLLHIQQELANLGSAPIMLDMCLAQLGPDAGQLVIRMAGSIASTSMDPNVHDGPGAPMRDPSAPIPADDEFLLDTGMIDQLMYSAWADGAFQIEQPQAVETGLLSLLIPEILDDYPDAQYADISVDALLPPLVRATPDVEGADMEFEIADMIMTVRIQGDLIVKLGVHLKLRMNLTPGGEAMAISNESEVWLLDEKYDSDDAALESAIKIGIDQGLGDVFGGGGMMGGVPVPEVIPGIGRIVDILPDADGRYLHFKLAPL